MHLLFIVFITMIISGCATVFSGTRQTLHIQAIDITNNDILEQARCTIMDGAGGSYYINNNPGTVTVARSSGPITVLCKADGYKQLNTSVGDSFNGASLINIIFWPGFLVDAVTGAYKKFPSHYLVAMEKITK
ncbi:hypothetical protein [Candidatus Trichorickettsia mobilis]|uniref:hypothetical protein n=1 Tax=Candidatus Trichorickettsia mobilis TaxID=1346319 RepID=UPI002930D736|nr:hypothetical protein [Candidatus Trichorickettsia mobilis]